MAPSENNNRSATRPTELWLALLLTLAAFGVRTYQLGSYSLSEDETAKWQAVQQYRQGHFAAVNAEHPMLMKVLAWGSISAGQQWNARAIRNGWPTVTPESALRLPNVVLGAATTFVLYLLARQMLGVAGSLAAASFWAFAPLPIALNRLLKEETPLVFFSLLGCYFYLQAKKAMEETETRRWLDLSAIGFGLALASKYSPLLFGLNALAWHVAGRTGVDSRPFAQRFLRFYLLLAVTFVLVNPVILIPANVHSVLHWIREGGLHHTGYNFDGRLYFNVPSMTLPTMPWYFYVWLLLVKTPLPLLAAILAGGLLLLQRRNSLAFAMFVSFGVVQLLGLSVFPAKWIRYVLGLLPFLFLAGGVAVQHVYDWLVRRGMGPRLAGVTIMLLIGCTQLDLTLWHPYYSLYLNALGGGSSRVAQYFSPDEISELDARQTASAVCQSAAPGTRLATSKPMTMDYYLERCGRTDIRIVPLYDRGYLPRAGDLILREESRRYFETESVLAQLRASQMPHEEIRVGPVVATTIYHFQVALSDQRQNQGSTAALVNNTIAQQIAQNRTLGTAQTATLAMNLWSIHREKEKRSQ